MAPAIPPQLDQASTSFGNEDASEAAAQEAVPANIAPPSAASRNYFSRHWHGQLTLPISYWANGVLLAVLILSATSGLDLALNSYIPETLVWISAATIWILIVTAILWQVVGTWRSASQSPQRGGSRFWAATAKATVLFGVIANFGLLSPHAIPQLIEMGRIAFGTDSNDNYSLRLLRSGTELEVAGGIGSGLTAQIRRLVEANDVKTLHLNSLGGRVGEARALRDLIQQRSLNTHTATGCKSACVIAFMAGKERSIAPGAQLGFHRYTFPGIKDSALDESINIDRRGWQRAGVSAAFLDRAFSTPSNDLWSPTVQELRDAKVITTISKPGDFAISGIRNDRATVERELLGSPLYVTVKKYEPDVYESVLTAAQRAVREGQSAVEFSAAIRAELAELVNKYIGSASDEALVDLTAVLIASMRELQRISTSDCLLYMSPQPGKAVDLTQLSPELQRRDHLVTQAVIESGASQIAGPKGEFVDSDLARLNLIMEQRFRSDLAIVDRLNDPTVDAAKACEIVATFYEEAMKVPFPRNAQLLRRLFS